MVFSSLNFIFIFLPVVLIMYYICPVRFRNAVLLMASLVFYAWGEPKYIIIMLGSTIFDYINGILLDRFMTRKIRWAKVFVLVVSVLGNLGILGVFKYVGPHVGIALPIGISFFTFQTMSYTIDVYRGEVKAQRNFLDFATYVTMFPQLIAGPIVRYKTIENQLHNRIVSVDKFAEGIKRFIIGLAKKVMLANVAGQLWEHVSAMASDERTMALSWLGAVGFAFQIYFDFSGYSDMAIGLGKMLGFDYEENFNYPYTGKSITEFWRRWHISLSTWFKEYVYIPLGGNKKGVGRQIINILIVWTLTGIWHGASVNFMLWGMYFGVLLIAEKLFLGKILKKIPAFFGHFYMMVTVVFGWIIFAVEDFKEMGTYIGNLFGTAGVWSSETAYVLVKFLILLLICAVGSTTLPKKLAGKLTGKVSATAGVVLQNVFLAVVFIVAAALIAADSYNPFLYFRF